MTGAARPPHDLETGSGWYVYGVVLAADASPDLFAAATTLHPEAPVVLVEDGELAAVASEVPLTEFGEGPLEEHLHDPAWLEEKARAHDGVLAAAVGQTPLVPFRFGTIVRNRQHVRDLLRRRDELSDTLARLRGKTELGVKAFLDVDRFRAGHSEAEAAGAEPASGTAYLRRKQLDRDLREAGEALKASCAEESHRQLASASEDARANPLHAPEIAGTAEEMLLNGAYLVRDERRAGFDETLDALRARYAPQGVRYELTGPWPPYNFVGEEDE